MKLPTHLYLFLFISIGIFNSCGTKSTTTTSSDAVVGDINLESFVDGIVQSEIDNARLAGMAVGVSKGGQTLLRKTYGFADLEHDVAMPLNASFEIGSVTKQFTAAAILQLAEAGKLSLDEDFTKYVPFDTRGHSIPILRLMDHTSGIKGYTESSIFGEIVTRNLPRDTLLRLIEKEPFDFDPGEAEIYNNTAFYILGLIIEKVSGQSYAEYVEENLFSKAGMDNSYYCDNSTIRKNRAHGYGMGAEGLVRASYLDHTWPYAAGSLCSTAEDLLKWLEALHGGKVLSDENYQSLITPGVLNDGTKIRYCKGINNYEYKGNQCIAHGGGINGFLTNSRYFPDEDLSIVVLVNTTGPVGPGNIADQISDELLEVTEMEPKPYDGDITSLSGSYSGAARGQYLTLMVEGKDDMILLKSENDTEADTFRYDGKFWSDGSPIQVSFVIENGQASEMRYDGIGNYFRLKRD